MYIEQFFPPKGLNEYIDYVWVVKAKDLHESKRKDIIMPLGHVNIIFNYGSKYKLLEAEEQKQISDVVIVGQIKKAKHVEYGQQLDQIGISLKPLGFLCLFGHQGIDITEQIVDAMEMDQALYELYEKIKIEKEVEPKVNEIYAYLKNNIVWDETFLRLKNMLFYMEEHFGNLNIEKMAEDFHISISALERYFKKNVGLTPKAYGNIMKFKKNIEDEKLRKDMQKNYYDQSHLIKNTQKFSDKTVGELEHVKHELTLQQVLKLKE